MIMRIFFVPDSRELARRACRCVVPFGEGRCEARAQTPVLADKPPESPPPASHLGSLLHTTSNKCIPCADVSPDVIRPNPPRLEHDPSGCQLHNGTFPVGIVGNHQMDRRSA